jgi:dTDP-4-dehydrorhamnose reductase
LGVIKVLVLGGNGMLGSMVTAMLGQNPGLEVAASSRDKTAAPGPPFRVFDADLDSVAGLLDTEAYGWIINAIGVTKPHIDEHDAASIERAVRINAQFPFRLAQEAERRGQRVIQIATDAVFSGTSGSYDEAAPHDALDVYGKTKSLGEAPAANVTHLRCSIIGPEMRDPPSYLLGWALSQPPGTRIQGHTNHRWNGITTLHFARLCEAIITNELELPSPLHIVPNDVVTKADLIEMALAAHGRNDIEVSRGPAKVSVDRSLASRHPEANKTLWSAAGYAHAPAVGEMVKELASIVDAARSG